MFRILVAILVLCVWPIAGSRAQSGGQAESIQFEVPIVPGAERYAALLERPAYLAVALESVGLSPSMSSRIKIADQGRAAEIRNAFVRYSGRQGDQHVLEAGILLGLGDSKLDLPVVVDTSNLAGGKAVIIVKPPLAKFVPAELKDRIRIKLNLVASPSAQQKLLEHLDRLQQQSGGKVDSGFFEAILADAYNRSGPSSVGGADRGDAVPLSEQWMLILTLVIWLVVLPVVLWRQRGRKVRPTPS